MRAMLLVAMVLSVAGAGAQETPALEQGARVRLYLRASVWLPEGSVTASMPDSVTVRLMKPVNVATPFHTFAWADLDSLHQRVKQPGYVERRHKQGAKIGFLVAMGLATVALVTPCRGEAFEICGPEGAAFVAILAGVPFTVGGFVLGLVASAFGPPYDWVPVPLPARRP